MDAQESRRLVSFRDESSPRAARHDEPTHPTTHDTDPEVLMPDSMIGACLLALVTVALCADLVLTHIPF